ncbi:hypothetical protein [Mycobacterium paragordonae]|uniref:hypothetical protein n=1 Tax=Mycobacterium paragordonae TaxID=1389713 RepID=UPI001E30DB7A|nr:hypothetical protein [Mycobacterium paragordonae]
MLTALAAIAVRGLGSCLSTAGSGGMPPRVEASKGAAPRGIWVVGWATIGGSGPVGARRMMRVRDSVGSAGLSLGGGSLGGGSFGPVTGQPA